MTHTDPLDALEAVIRARRGADPASSYTASLFARGRPRMAQKLGEEATEAVIAAIQGDREALKGEAADLVFHLLVLLVDMGLRLDDVRAVLAQREGVSGLVEKAARPSAAAPPPVVASPASPTPGLPLGRADDEGRPRPLKLSPGDH